MRLNGVVAAVMIVLPAFTTAQSSAAVNCSPCRIQVQPTLALGTESGIGAIEHLESRAVRDGQGRYLVKGHYASSLLVYDNHGRFLRSIGQKGSGPGEFQGIAAIAPGLADSLFVFDGDSRRYSVYAPDLSFVAAGLLPLGPELISLVLPSGEFVFGLPLRTPAQIGQPLHVVSRDGRLLRSLGSKSGLFRPDIPWLDSRAIGIAPAGMLWSAFRTQYVVERWNPRTGQFVSAISRTVPWFPSRMQPVRTDRADPEEPEPFLMDIREDTRAVLWVLIAVPDSNWRRTVTRPSGAQHMQIRDPQEYYDTVLEALDARTGRLLASVRLPQYVRQFVADNEIGTVVEDSDGIPRLQLWRVTLHQE